MQMQTYFRQCGSVQISQLLISKVEVTLKTLLPEKAHASSRFQVSQGSAILVRVLQISHVTLSQVLSLSFPRK